MSGSGFHDELESLAELSRSDAAARADARNRAFARARFLERADAELGRSERSSRRVRWLLPAFAAGTVLLVWTFWPRSLDFSLEGAPRDGAYVRAPADRPVTVRFSDRTTLVATPGSRLRVEDAGWRDARVVVERGKADVHVVHDDAREWRFVAGPFEVLVTGTRFSLDWDPLGETFDLVLREGSVEVRGPTGSGPVVLRAGQRFQGDAQRKRMLVSEAADRVAPSVPPGEGRELSGVTPAPVPVEPTRGSDAAVSRRADSTARRSPATASSWQELIARGEFAKIIAEAEARGIETCLSACRADDLRALSDAARYTGQTQLAEQGLLSLRKRFGAGAGRDAAFLLGRLAEQRGAMAAAESWYATYLRDAPSDAFAAEALAGAMRAAKALRGIAAARPLAKDYLERFPKGVHARTALDILGEE